MPTQEYDYTMNGGRAKSGSSSYYIQHDVSNDFKHGMLGRCPENWHVVNTNVLFLIEVDKKYYVKVLCEDNNREELLRTRYKNIKVSPDFRRSTFVSDIETAKFNELLKVAEFKKYAVKKAEDSIHVYNMYDVNGNTVVYRNLTVEKSSRLEKYKHLNEEQLEAILNNKKQKKAIKR